MVLYLRNEFLKFMVSSICLAVVPVCCKADVYTISKPQFERVNPMQNTSFICNFNWILIGRRYSYTGNFRFRINGSARVNDGIINYSEVKTASSGFSRSSNLTYNIGHGFNLLCFVAYIHVGANTMVTTELGDSVQVTPFALPTFHAPAPLSFKLAGNNQLIVTWPDWNNEADQGEGPAIGYILYHRQHTNGWSDTSFIEGTSYNESGLVEGVTYDFAISVVREGPGGTGPRSISQTLATCMVINARAQHNDLKKSLAVTWNFLDSEDCNIHQFRLEYYLKSHIVCGYDAQNQKHFQINSSAASRNKNITDLQDFAKYDITITALEMNDVVIHSANIIGTTIAGVPDEPPSVTYGREENGQLRFVSRRMVCYSLNGPNPTYNYILKEHDSNTEVRKGYGQNRNGIIVEVPISELKACQTYDFQIRVENEGFDGPYSNTSTVTVRAKAFEAVGNLEVSPTRPHTLLISWQVPGAETNICTIDGYRISVSMETLIACGRTQNLVINETTSSNFYKLTGLSHFAEYSVVVTAFGSQSTGTAAEVNGRILESGSLKVTSQIDGSQLTFRWTSLDCAQENGNISSYHYEFNDEAETTSNEYVNVSPIVPCRTYRFRVRASTGETRLGPWSLISEVTAASAAHGQVQSVVHESTSTGISLQWRQPNRSDNECPLTAYIIRYRFQRYKACASTTISQEYPYTTVTSTSATLSGLHAFATYQIEIIPLTTDDARGTGLSVSADTLLAEGTPDGYGAGCDQVCYCQGGGTCHKFTGVCQCSERFSGSNCQEPPPSGVGILIGIIVAVIIVIIVFVLVIWKIMYLMRKKKENKNNTSSSMQSKSNAGSSTYYMDLTSPSTSGTLELTEQEYLKPDSVQAKSGRGGLQKTPRPTDPHLYYYEDTGNSSSANLDLSVSKDRHGLEYEPTVLSGVESTIYEEVDSKWQNVGPVRVTQFVTFVNAAKHGILKNHFKTLTAGKTAEWTTAQKKENLEKNNTRNILPYDHSRVILKYKGQDLYYNASYIKDSTNTKAFIAAEGPRGASLKNFWRLIWCKKINTIIMATDLKENWKECCIMYWPAHANSSLVFTNLFVTLVEEIEFPGFTQRVFNAKQDEEVRTIHQFHIFNWPNTGIPHFSPVLFLIDIMKMNLVNNDHSSPLLVHCNNGIGRTGTLIALYHLLDVMRQKNTIDVFGFVESMRKDRINMVETERQYIFLHEALACGKMIAKAAIPYQVFQTSYQRLLSFSPGTGKTNLEDEFELLNGFSAKFQPDSFKEAMKAPNVQKNRQKKNLPLDDFRPLLSSACGYGGNDYINATITCSLQSKETFIITQHPLENTVEDFWRLVFEWKCVAVVMLNDMDTQSNAYIQYWPYQSKTFSGGLTATMTSLAAEDEWTKRVFKVVNANDQDTLHRVHHFQLLGWPSNQSRRGKIQSINSLVTTVMEMKIAEPKSGPVLVHCTNGVGRSGVFCTLWCENERSLMSSDGTVNVFASLLHLRTMQPHLIDTQDLYKLCYTALQDDIQSSQPYGNI